MSHAVNSALLGLRNIIKDSDNMEWYAPNKMYKFEMQRYDCNSNIITTNSNSNYIIEIRIKNNIGIEMYKIRMNEIDMVGVVDQISFYEYELQENFANILIRLNPCNNYNQIGTETRMRIQREPEYMIPPEIQPVIFDKNTDEYRNNHVQIFDYNYKTGIETDILNIWISDTELDDLTFDLYFVGLMDVPLPDESIITLENMFTRMYGYGPYGMYDDEAD